MALKPGKKAYAELMVSFSKSPKGSHLPNNEKLPVLASRANEVLHEAREKVLQRRVEIQVNGFPIETYRRIVVEDALNILQPKQK
ncbi:hypothetical protein CRD36_02055 [Paremcibacter congregatus]|uniref:Uncharacterized protein n=1 Tax=Paremcibacter congregatus TaxID=2043170 RepID=A0A2G4YY45_9PROT|nr:hypothetical protein CRD36_02055 [Paremcibacter congregatus]QDE27988.1 hypothetical protein FIV45_12255 [Paremcibacter congregatus]